MASVVKQAGSKFWIAAFRDATGKQHRRSTGETVKTRALDVAKQFERVSKGKGNRHGSETLSPISTVSISGSICPLPAFALTARTG